MAHVYRLLPSNHHEERRSLHRFGTMAKIEKQEWKESTIQWSSWQLEQMFPHNQCHILICFHVLRVKICAYPRLPRV